VKKPVHNPREVAEIVAIQALSFVAGEPERLGLFLAETGVGPETLRNAASDPNFLLSVLDFVLRDDDTVKAFAKAAELHLARCLALEGAPFGIRVNVVNPDAVLRGSRIWQGEWAQQRAAQYNKSVDELESVYRERSLLKRSVYPEDVAEAVAFFASERSAKSTGNIVNVDAGNAGAFTR